MGMAAVSEGIVPALNNGVATSEEAAHKVNLSGIQSKKQRYVMILLGQAAEKGVTVGEVRDSTPKYHHGSVSGILSTLHSRDRVVALRQPRDGQTVYVLPEHLNGREARPYGRRDPKLTEHNVLALLILESDLMEWGVSDKQLAQAAKRIVKELS